jgi:hypothetical protein
MKELKNNKQIKTSYNKSLNVNRLHLSGTAFNQTVMGNEN